MTHAVLQSNRPSLSLSLSLSLSPVIINNHLYELKLIDIPPIPFFPPDTLSGEMRKYMSRAWPVISTLVPMFMHVSNTQDYAFFQV